MIIKRIAFIEDDVPKRDAIVSFLNEKFSGASVFESKSVKGARKLIADVKPDIVLLDMSLPTFEITDVDQGGRPQGLGGIEVMRYMLRDRYFSPVVVVTGYQEFSQHSRYMSLDKLKSELLKEFSSIFCGLVTFNALSDGWKDELLSRIMEISKDV